MIHPNSSISRRESNDLSPVDLNAHLIHCASPIGGDDNIPEEPRIRTQFEYENRASTPNATVPRLSSSRMLSPTLFQEIGLNTFKPGPNSRLGMQPFRFQPTAFTSEDAEAAMEGGWFLRLLRNMPPFPLDAPLPKCSSFFELMRGTLHEYPIIGEDHYQPMQG